MYPQKILDHMSGNLAIIYLNAKETQPLFLPHGSHEANFLIISRVSAHLVMIYHKMVLLTISDLTL